jgi:hypothetical protein
MPQLAPVPAGQRLGRLPGANTPIFGRGRPALRLAAWRAAMAALPNKPVTSARFAHLTATRFRITGI